MLLCDSVIVFYVYVFYVLTAKMVTTCYIAGFYTYTVGNAIQCEECKVALMDSEEDPCINMSLIEAKNWEDSAYGLSKPSGSLCKLLMLN